MTNDKLRGVFEGLGLEDVASVLASGNIVFRADAAGSADTAVLEQRIEDALALELGISSRTLVRTHAELRALVDSDPFPGLTHGTHTYLTATFIKDPEGGPETLPGHLDPSTRIVRYDPAARAVLAVTDNDVPASGRSVLSWLEETFGKSITTRSWLNVQKIVRRLES